MTSELDLEKIRRSAEPGAMFGAIIVRDLVNRLEQAEQAVARVREALSNHPHTCDQHTEDDPVKCGWKRAVIDVQNALDGDTRRLADQGLGGGQDG